MKAVVPVRVPEELAQKIQRLIDAGLYQSRSSLIREAVRRLVASESIVAQKTAVGKFVATLIAVMISLEEKAVTDVILFGSVVRGEATAESDVDLLVLVKGVEGWRVRQHLYDLIYPVILASGVDVSLIVRDREDFVNIAQAGDPFAISVISEGVQLYGGFLNEYGEGAFRKSR